MISKEYPTQVALSQPEAKFLFHDWGIEVDYGLRLSYLPARQHRLAESIPRLLKILKMPSEGKVIRKFARQK